MMQSNRLSGLLFSAALTLAALQSCNNVAAPEPVLPVPTAEQLAWQKMENYAFVHFGLNTYNDLEWGYGNTPASTFTPEILDCDQWVSTIKAAGLKGVILTAKHHDGFCLWPTSTTDYNISNSPYKNGKGDLVKELSDACHRQGLKFGLYLSPWDRNNAEYGREGYQKTYHAQINELISNYGPLFEFWFDGANGGNGWYGGADEVRSITPETYYGYEEARRMIKEKHPDAMIFGGSVPDIRWIGNERGWAGETSWSMYDRERPVHFRQLQWGMEDADQWLPGECDVSIRPGWFYHHREDHQVKTVSQLIDLYYRSVGHNANLLLNFPVALDGKIARQDSTNAVEAYQALQREFAHDLLAGIVPECSESRGHRFSGANVTDGDWDSYWATPDGVVSGSLIFRFQEKTDINRVMLQEYIPLGQRVRSFSIEVAGPEGWMPVEAEDSLTTVGYKRLVRFKTVSSDALKITFQDARGPLCINEIKAFNAPKILELPIIRRDGADRVSMTTISGDTQIWYALDGASPLTADGALDEQHAILYTGDFLMDRKTVVKAVSYDESTGTSSPVAIRTFDIPASHYAQVHTSGKGSESLFDDDGRTVFSLPAQEKDLKISLDESMTISGFVYNPDQRRDAVGHISSYEFYVDGKKVASGEFSNIRNNPIAQTIRFAPVCGKTVILRCLRTAGDVRKINIADFSIITE